MVKALDCEIVISEFYFKLFSLVKLIQTIQFSLSTVSMSKAVLFETIQFSLQKHFYFKQFNLAEVLCLVLFDP